jgi:hypothetical protein
MSDASRSALSAAQQKFSSNRLSPDILSRISSDLEVAQLAQAEVLAETHARIEKVYLPRGGIISCVVQTIIDRQHANFPADFAEAGLRACSQGPCIQSWP